MGKWAELNDFSMYEGNCPCTLCKADSSKTLVGDHWKCSVCSHLFNIDGSDVVVECYCDKCQAEQQPEEVVLDVEVLKTIESMNGTLVEGSIAQVVSKGQNVDLGLFSEDDTWVVFKENAIAGEDFKFIEFPKEKAVKSK